MVFPCPQPAMQGLFTGYPHIHRPYYYDYLKRNYMIKVGDNNFLYSNDEQMNNNSYNYPNVIGCYFV